MTARRSNASTDLEKLIHDCEFENQQYVKLIEHEDTLLSNIEKEIEWKRGEIIRIEGETPLCDAEIKQLHRQFVQNRDNLESQKITTQILTDQIAATTKKFEVLNIQKEQERVEHQAALKHYQETATRYKDWYEARPLAIECKNAKEREEELKQQVLEKKNNINRLNQQMQLLLCRREGKTMTREDQEFIVKLAQARLANLKLVHEVGLKRKQLEDMKKQIEQRQNQILYTAEKIENVACTGEKIYPGPPRQTTDMDSAMISLYSSRDETGETMQDTEDNAGPIQQPDNTKDRDPPQSWLSSFQKLQVQQTDTDPPEVVDIAVKNVPAKTTTKSPVPPYVSYRRSDLSEDSVQVHLQRPSRPVVETLQTQQSREQFQQRPGPAIKRTLPSQTSPRVPILMTTNPAHTAPSPEAVKQRLKVPKLELNTQFTRNIGQSLNNPQIIRHFQPIRRETTPRQAIPIVQVPRKPTVTQSHQQPRQISQSGIRQFSPQHRQIQNPRMIVAASPQTMTSSPAVSQLIQPRAQASPSEKFQMLRNQTFCKAQLPSSSQSSHTQIQGHISQNMSQSQMTNQNQPRSQSQASAQQYREISQMQEPHHTIVSPQKYAQTVQPQQIQTKRQEQDYQNHQLQEMGNLKLKSGQDLQAQQNQTRGRDQPQPNNALSPPQEQCGSSYIHQEQDMTFKIPKSPAPKKHRSPPQSFQRVSHQNNSFQDTSVNSPTSPINSVVSPQAGLSYPSPTQIYEIPDQDATNQVSSENQTFSELPPQARNQESKEQEIRLKMLGPKEPYFLKLKPCPEGHETSEAAQDTSGKPIESEGYHESNLSPKNQSISPEGTYHTNKTTLDQSSLEASMEMSEDLRSHGDGTSDAKSPGGNAFSPFNMKKHKEKLAELNKSPGAPMITSGRRMFPSKANEDENSNTQVEINASGDNVASMEKEPAFNFRFGGSKSPNSDPPMMFGFGSGDSTDNNSRSAFSLFGQSTGDSSPVGGFNFMGKSSESTQSTQQAGNFGIFGVGAPSANEQDNSDYLSSLFGPAGDEEEQSSSFSFSFEPSSVSSVKSPQQKSFSLF